VSNIEGDKPDFDDVNTPTEQFDALAADGMPDPTVAENLAAKAKPEKKTAGLLGKIAASADPFTVMLAIALLAILIAICCLVAEWGTYGYDTKARQRGAIDASSPFPPNVLLAQSDAPHAIV
jgi:hypothetical protein